MRWGTRPGGGGAGAITATGCLGGQASGRRLRRRGTRARRPAAPTPAPPVARRRAGQRSRRRGGNAHAHSRPGRGGGACAGDAGPARGSWLHKRAQLEGSSRGQRPPRPGGQRPCGARPPPPRGDRIQPCARPRCARRGPSAPPPDARGCRRRRPSIFHLRLLLSRPTRPTAQRL